MNVKPHRDSQIAQGVSYDALELEITQPAFGLAEGTTQAPTGQDFPHGLCSKPLVLPTQSHPNPTSHSSSRKSCKKLLPVRSVGELPPGLCLKLMALSLVGWWQLGHQRNLSRVKNLVACSCQQTTTTCSGGSGISLYFIHSLVSFSEDAFSPLTSQGAKAKLKADRLRRPWFSARYSVQLQHHKLRKVGLMQRQALSRASSISDSFSHSHTSAV